MKAVELIVSGLSLSLLFGFTLAFFFEAYLVTFSPSVDDVNDDVDPVTGNFDSSEKRET